MCKSVYNITMYVGDSSQIFPPPYIAHAYIMAIIVSRQGVKWVFKLTLITPNLLHGAYIPQVKGLFLPAAHTGDVHALQQSVIKRYIFSASWTPPSSMRLQI